MYRLTIVRNDGKTIVQSGFKIQGKSGIITALHGVINYSTITANNYNNQYSIGDLDIIKVDVSHDIAILNVKYNSNTIPLPDGIVIAQNSPSLEQFVTTLSYPLGMRKPFIRFSTEEGAIFLKEKENLINRIGVNAAKYLINRKSPDTNEKLYILTGPLQQGESGGAILNNQNQVVAIIDGGNGGINWAIPINIIQTKNISTEIPLLNNISSRNPEELFSTVLIGQGTDFLPDKRNFRKIQREESFTVNNSINVDDCYIIKDFPGSVLALRLRPLTDKEIKTSNLCINRVIYRPETNEQVKMTYPESNNCRLKQQLDEETSIGLVKRNDEVKLIKQEGKWYKIKVLLTGEIGYVVYRFRGENVLVKSGCN